MNGKARHDEIYETLRSEILNGKFAGSASFPSENALARRFGVGRQTVYLAVSRLRNENLVRRLRGSGTFLTNAARRKGGAIMAIAPSFPSSEIYPVVCRELSRICQEGGRLFCYADGRSDNARDTLARLRNSVRAMAGHGVSGVIFRPVDYYDDSDDINRKIVADIRQAGLPVVLLDCDIGGQFGCSGLDVVGVDNMMVGMTLGRHVAERGAVRVLFVRRARVSVNVSLRRIGIKAALDGVRGAKLEDFGLADGSSSEMASCIRRFRPDAIIGSGDVVAAQALKVLEQMGLRVPQDVLVAGVDDVEIAGMTSPSLTTVRQPCAEIARAAFDLLEWRTRHPDAVARRVALDTRLVVRESTGGAGGMVSEKKKGKNR